mgnify:CR=1 FL=1
MGMAELNAQAEEAKKAIEQNQRAKNGEPEPTGESPEQGKPKESEQSQPQQLDYGFIPEPQQQTQPEPAPQQPQPVKTDPANYEERFKGLKRHHDQLVPQLRHDLQQRDQAIQQLQQQVQQLIEQVQNQPQSFSLPEGIVTEDDMNAVGEESLPVIMKIARQMAQDAIKPMQQEFQQFTGYYSQKEQEQQAEMVKSAQQEFIHAVKEVIPNVLEINSSEHFKHWLHQADPRTGQSRAQTAQIARESFDVNSMVNLFDAYLREHNVSKPVDHRREQVIPGQRPSVDADPSLNPQAQKRNWTQAEINRFFNDVRRKVVPQDQVDAIKADIFAAYNEGRIIG